MLVSGCNEPDVLETVMLAFEKTLNAPFVDIHSINARIERCVRESIRDFRSCFLPTSSDNKARLIKMVESLV